MEINHDLITLLKATDVAINEMKKETAKIKEDKKTELNWLRKLIKQDYSNFLNQISEIVKEYDEFDFYIGKSKDGFSLSVSFLGDGGIYLGIYYPGSNKYSLATRINLNGTLTVNEGYYHSSNNNPVYNEWVYNWKNSKDFYFKSILEKIKNKKIEEYEKVEKEYNNALNNH